MSDDKTKYYEFVNKLKFDNKFNESENIKAHRIFEYPLFYLIIIIRIYWEFFRIDPSFFFIKVKYKIKI